MKGLWLLFFACLLFGNTRNIEIQPSVLPKGIKIKILDQKELNYGTVGGLGFSEISDLVYDKAAKRLYMLSDEGKLFVFKARFGEVIEQLEPVDAATIRKRGGKPFRKWAKDTEGMTIDGQGRLLISFEGKAKVGWFHKDSEKMGERIRKYTLPKVLRDTKHYRSKNKSLEALAWHPKYGILTVAEWPLKRDPKKRQTVYALNGRRWHFQAEPEARSAVSAIEVTDDGNLLVLERSFTGLFDPFVITLKKVYLKGCSRNGMCRTEILAKMNSHRGWQIDNFEGLAKVGKHRYVMVSDDNDNFYQRTLLVYFEVLP